jgi:transcriptional regulator with XRE-family HTH domain
MLKEHTKRARARVSSAQMRVPTGYQIAAGRALCGLSQAEIAREAGDLDPSAISRLESSGADPVTGRIEVLRKVLDVFAAHGVELTDDGVHRVPTKPKPRR